MLLKTAKSYAHDLVITAEINNVKMLKLTLEDEDESKKIKYINKFHLQEIKQALNLLEQVNQLANHHLFVCML
jgi:hypothetical protein